MTASIRIAASFALILLYVYAAVSKLLSFDEFREQLYNQTFPKGLADILLVALPVAELVIAWMISTNFFERTGLWLSAGLLVAFTIYIGLVLSGVWDR